VTRSFILHELNTCSLYLLIYLSRYHDQDIAKESFRSSSEAAAIGYNQSITIQR